MRVPVPVHKQVRGLEISMHEIMLVCKTDCLHNLSHQRHSLLDRWCVRLHPVSRSCPSTDWHNTHVVTVLLHVVNGHQSRMLEPSCLAGLLQEGVSKLVADVSLLRPGIPSAMSRR